MKYRKLRIAFTTVCGVFCLLLIALWVRSYWIVDTLELVTRTGVTRLQSSAGSIVYHYTPIRLRGLPESARPLLLQDYSQGRLLSSWAIPPDTDVLIRNRRAANLGLGFGFSFSNVYSIGIGPYPIALSIAVAFAALPWLRWRFSLRTLLIATMVIAVVLGMIVWAAR